MSRIGNRILSIPSGVTVTVSKSNEVAVKGPLGELSRQFDMAMKITVENDTIKVERPNELKRNKMLHGTTNALIGTMIEGVSNGYKKTLIIEGVGSRASVQGRKVIFELGYSHPIEYDMPEGINVEVEKNTTVHISGIDKEKVGLEAAKIRKFRKPTVYLSGKTKQGRGIRYADERIKYKVGKKA